jgi:serine/threonine protein kinase
MPARIYDCDLESLRFLAEDRLSPREIAGLEEHLENCDSCRTALDRLIGGDRWVEAARHYLGPESTGGYDPENSDVGVLDCLAPSDWPDSLGRMGTYEVKGVLGRGGMGVVLKAFDSALNRNVAIKVLSASLANCGAARRRFLREARAAAADAHEHVVAVHAVVESAGLPFLVMEYVPGRSLQDRLDKDGPLGLQEVLRIGMQTAAGLAAAHAQGLVHRDVKPANILLENGVERVRLTDFGLARATADAGVTQSGVVTGTPHYMAPEQARAEATDHRADLFSLGSTLYAMCAGHPPFRADSVVAVLRRVSDEQPRPLREINPDTPDWLAAIISRLHAKSPGERFQSAAEVAELLSRCLAHVREPLSVPLPFQATPQSRRQLGFRSRRSRWVAVVLAMISLGAGVMAIPARRKLEQPPPSIDPVGLAPTIPHVAPATTMVHGGADEFDQQFSELWARALAMEATLTGAGHSPERDSVLTLARDLSQRAESLAHEIAAGHEMGARQTQLRYSFQP